MRGRFRILLGAAAGVGKTHRMLQEGRQAATEGVDVVIGYLEPHDRPETAALAEASRRPRRRVEHRRRPGARQSTEALVRRAPELALIDELAHTNAPGSLNPKRYLDIEEVLDAGIDVISTVNVQHLESLNDTVFELTGVRVRETFPDRILDEADEVVLVDLAPRSCRSGCAPGRCTRRSGSRPRSRTSSGRQPGGAAPARAARAVRGRRGPAGDACARPRGPASHPRADPRPGHAPAELATAAAPGLALGPAARRRHRRALRAPAGARRCPRSRRRLAALRRLAQILGAHFLEEESDDVIATVARP